MRNAVENGVLWITKFLIDKGCPTKNLPSYGQWKHELESRQLIEILKEKVENHSGLEKNIYWKNKLQKIMYMNIF